MFQSRKTILLGLAKFAIPVSILSYLAIYHIDWLAFAAQPKNYGLLSIALLVALSAVSLSFARWWLLVRCLGISLSLIDAFRISAISFLLNFVSAGSVGGDLFKAIFLARQSAGKRVESVASVLVDRGIGLYGLVLIASLALFVTNTEGVYDQQGELVSSESLGPKAMNQMRWGALALAIIGTAALSVLVFGGQSVDRLLGRASKRRTIGKLFKAVGPPLRMFHEHKIGLCASILISLAVHSLLVVSMYLIARSLYAAPPTLVEHFVIVPIGMLAAAVPISPAGLGVYEVVIDKLYRTIPRTPTNASGALVGLVFEIVKIIMAIIGTVFFWAGKKEVQASLHDAEEQMTLEPPAK